MAPENDGRDPSLTPHGEASPAAGERQGESSGSTSPAIRSAAAGDDSGDPSAMGDPPPPTIEVIASLEDLEASLLEERRKVTHALKKARRLDQLNPKYQRSEIGSVGFDDFLQTIGGDPHNGMGSTGVLIPQLVANPGGERCRYLILGSTVELKPGDYVVGWRCALTLAAIIGTGAGEGPTAPFYRMERPIVTPFWRPQDAAYSFHLTYEPMRPQTITQGPLDQESFVFRDAGGPAMLYETATIPAVPSRPGYLGLDSYTPPSMLGQEFHVTRDIRDPWTKGSFEYLKFPITYPTRIRAYLSVLQTDPVHRIAIVVANTALASAGIPPEESFLQVFNGKGVPGGVQFNRGAISLLIDRRIAA